MKKTIVFRAFALFLLSANICSGAGCSQGGKKPAGKTCACPVEQILKSLRESAGKLKTYSCKIEYVFSQPDFESQTLRSGMLYYQKGKKKSHLRINFDTLQQDDEKPQKYKDEYIFDGTWLIHLDYGIKSDTRRRLAEPNDSEKTVDIFEMVSRQFPIIGFSSNEDLKKNFDISLVGPKGTDPNEPVHLKLKVKPESAYKDEYTVIDFWIDSKLKLPAKIVAKTTEDEYFRIRFLSAKVNKKLPRGVFKVKVPKSFGKPQIIEPERARK